MAVALCMIALPIGGGVRLAMAAPCVPGIPLRWDQHWLLEPRQVVLASACLVVLALAASLRWRDEPCCEL